MLNLLRCDCGNPECSHPTPTLYDWYSLAYCCYPRTTRVVQFIATVLAYFLAVLVFWAVTFIIFALDVDPWYG